jgi:glutamate dehydrogenase/leucine dehydrogenase
MRKAYQDVAAVAREHSLDMRTAAFVLAIRRVAKAALSRTALRAEVPELRA